MKRKHKPAPLQTVKHCDDYIDDLDAPAPLRAYLARARSPAHGMLSNDPYPQLYATYIGKTVKGVRCGARVRVVMASTLGDVGITTDLSADVGYQLRCAVADLTEFSDVSSSIRGTAAARTHDNDR